MKDAVGGGKSRSHVHMRPASYWQKIQRKLLAEPPMPQPEILNYNISTQSMPGGQPRNDPFRGRLLSAESQAF